MIITKRNAHNRKLGVTLLAVDKDDPTKVKEFYPSMYAGKVFTDISETNTVIDHIVEALENKHIPRGYKDLLSKPATEGGLVKLNKQGVIPYEYINPKSIVLYFSYDDFNDLLEHNNLDPDEDYGRLVMVSDIGESSNGRSWGIYRLIGRDTHSIDSYQRIISHREMDRTADWSEFASLFKHTPEEIDEGVSKTHYHENQKVLDNITEHDDGYVYYHGKRISVREDFRAIIATKDPNLNDVLNGDLALKLESERPKSDVEPKEPLTEIKILEGNCDYEYRGDDTITQGPLLRTNKVTSTKGFFESCINLTSIPAYDMRSVVTADDMFKDCAKLQGIPGFNFEALTSANYFCANSGIKSISEIVATRLISGDYMFYNCTKLQSIDLIKLPNAKDLNYAFGLCTSLGSINSDINLTQAINLRGLFFKCRSLKHVNKVITPRATIMTEMFKDCISLRDIAYIDFTNCTNAEDMFSGCASLKHVGIKEQSLHINLSLANTRLDEVSIRKILKELPNVVSEGGYTLDITNTPAADSLLESEVSAMLVYGWTIKR